jgi:hypothetical protein
LKAVEHLEVIATVAQKQISIVFRRNISGIHQRLGEVVLKENEDEIIDVTAWTAIAVTRAEGLELEIVDLGAKYKEQAEVLKQLNQQLEDLIQAKTEHDNVLLMKFRDLLNEKKLKIRDQQRLLAISKVNPARGVS